MIDKIINSLSKINEKYPNINWGGCGTFSYHLHNVLKDKYNIDTEIVYIKSDTPPGGRPDYDIKFSHILLKYEKCYIDNNKVYSDIVGIEKLDISKLEEMITIPELWNNIFDHSKSNDLKNDLYLL